MTIAPPRKTSDNPRLRPVYGYDAEGYLVSDGLPMAETAHHRQEMNDCIESLSAYYAEDPDVLVGGNNFVHSEKGNRKNHVAPDCYVVKGVSKRLRDNFKVWEEGAAPCVVFEFTSEETKNADIGRKFTLYEQTLKTAEYFLFDPKHEYLTPPLQGYRLHEGRYERIAPDERSRLWSEELGLWLEQSGDKLRLFNPLTGEYLRTPAEAERERLQEKARADAQQERADAEASARAKAEAELTSLRAQLEALRQQQQSESNDANS